MKLIVCRGLPASGKTTAARAWVAEDPAARARVNRDDIRAMLHNGVYLGETTEAQVRALQLDAVVGLLVLGPDVICDDTNLKPDIFDRLLAAAALVDADVEVWDMRDVPVEVCVKRDRARQHPVGEDVIRRMAAEWLENVRLPR